jgi:ribosomal protein S12 methylthiotransferase accessory factor YcaO
VALASVGRGDEVSVITGERLRACAGLRLAQFERIGIRWLARNLTCDTGVPTVLATIAEAAWVHFGVASHPDGRIALARALDEAAQGRLVDLQGAREDLLERDAVGVDPWFTEAGRRAWSTSRRWDRATSRGAGVLGRRLAVVGVDHRR